MRLLIVNPNTSEGVTRRIDAAAQAVATHGDTFKTVSAAYGPQLIVTDQDGLDAVGGVLASVDAHSDGFDGIVLASFGDTGTQAVRSAYPNLPVVGIASAAFATARCLGGRFSIVTFDPSLSPALRERAEFHGMGDLLHNVVAVEDDNPFDPGDVQIQRLDALKALCDACAEDPITSIILGGGPLAGVSSQIKPAKRVVIIDGTQAAIGILRSAINR
jgi:allantoin racemase